MDAGDDADPLLPAPADAFEFEAPDGQTSSPTVGDFLAVRSCQRE